MGRNDHRGPTPHLLPTSFGTEFASGADAYRGCTIIGVLPIQAARDPGDPYNRFYWFSFDFHGLYCIVLV
jgi:hypothetical protein